MSSSTWQDHFKEQLVGLEPPREGSFLEMALSEGRVAEKDYLEWASQAHLVPLVSPQYFTEMHPDPALLEKASLPWRSTFFPVAEWDGHLVVAGLEVPSTLPPSCSFVLASRESLSLWWEKLAEHSKPLEGPEGIDLELGGDESLDLPLETSPAPSLSFAGVSVAAPVAAPDATEETPAAAAEEGPTLAEESSPTPVIPLMPSASAEEVAAPLPEEPRPDTGSGISIENLEQTQTRTFIALDPVPIPAPPKQPVAIKNNPTLEKHGLSAVSIEIASFKSDIQKSLTALTGAYPKTLLLVLDEHRKALIPLIWNESFKAPPALQKIPLGSPSMFEIVSSTEKPYHGPVIPNEINTQFLMGWNGGAQPETLTIVPLIGAGHLRGMILGIGPQSSYTLAILRYAERVAADLMKTWKLENHSAA